MMIMRRIGTEEVTAVVWRRDIIVELRNSDRRFLGWAFYKVCICGC